MGLNQAKAIGTSNDADRQGLEAKCPRTGATDLRIWDTVITHRPIEAIFHEVDTETSGLDHRFYHARRTQ